VTLVPDERRYLVGPALVAGSFDQLRIHGGVDEWKGSCTCRGGTRRSTCRRLAADVHEKPIAGPHGEASSASGTMT
jgi:hypothetical protein